MKLRSTTPALRRIALIGIAIVFSVSVQLPMFQQVFADKWDDQISSLRTEAEQYQAQANRLRAEADTLQNKLDQINAEIAILRATIGVNQAKHNKLKDEIAANQQKLKDTQDALGEVLASLYVDGNISSIELLASSNNIGDFVDKQEYRSSVRDQLGRAIAEVKKIRAQLEEDKKSVEKVLAELNQQNEQLGMVQSQQQTLVNQTRGEEAAYQQLVAKNKDAIQKARAEQAAYFASLQSSGSGGTVVAGDPNKGGYPANLANAAQDSLVDPWGMYNRECVSYVAWKVHQAFGNMPYWGGIGNAWQWGFSGWKDGYGRKVSYNSGMWHTSNAQALGVPSGTTPKPKSVAVRNANPGAGDQFGHVAWVEHVYGDGRILISQYNYYNAGGPGWGHYSEMIVNSSFFNGYIYFGEW